MEPHLPIEPGSDFIEQNNDVKIDLQAPMQPLCNTVRTARSGKLDTVGKLVKGTHMRNRWSDFYHPPKY